ncbi:MAG: hypothetical protein ACPGVB_05520 [Chitinophagales bacterium]
MNLGTQVFILLPVSNLTANIIFFEQLGYSRIADCQATESFSILTDGKTHLLLDEGYFGGKGIVYFQANINKTLTTLKSRGCTFSIKNHPNQESIQATFTEPNGTKIILSNHSIFQKLPVSSSSSFSLKIGQLSELTLTTLQIDDSLHFWKKMGFNCVFYRSWENKDFGSRAILSDGLINIGIHETNQFEGMKLTYLDSKMPQRIIEVKKSGIPTHFEMIPIKKKVFAAAGIAAPNGTELYLFKRKSYLDLMHFPEYKQKKITA